VPNWCGFVGGIQAQKLSARLSPLRSSKQEEVVTEVPCEVAHEGLMVQQQLGIVSRVGGEYSVFFPMYSCSFFQRIDLRSGRNLLLCLLCLVLFCIFVFLVVGNIKANAHSRIPKALTFSRYTQ
jgi:hypothetical protein